jgi:uncharacterized protein (DUF302 family)
MKGTPMKYGISRTVSLPYDQAVARVTEELGREGFGVLTTIDIRETLRKKLNIEFDKYVILGACNPPFAHKALTAETEVGLLLPCNVIVYEKGGITHVSAFDPMVISLVSNNSVLQEVAEAVRAKLELVISRV